MSFLETPRFSSKVSFGSRGGPSYNTRIAKYGAGYESRDILWTYPMHRYDAAYGIKSKEDLYTVLDFFHVMRGRAYSFRYKDPMDFKSCAVQSTVASTDQNIGTGDSTTTEFQLVKNYTQSTFTIARPIRKPVTGSVVIALDGTPTTAFSVSSTNGVVTFAPAPASSVVITAGYEFDVPCRFDIDYLPIDLTEIDVGKTSIPIVEDKFHSVPST